jgi:hypothetical protein
MKAACPNHRVTRLYCQNCLEDGNHEHFPLNYIGKMLQQFDAKWSQLRQVADTFVPGLKPNLKS